MTTVRPSGTVTFLFTDIEGSTRLWEVDPASMREAVAAHEVLLASAITGHGGQVVKIMGDGVMAVFADATDAARAAFDAQLGLTKLDVFKVRMGVHTGTADERDGDYYGPTLNRAARLMGIAHGGQILLSEATAALTRGRVDLVDLGEHRLRDLNRSERVYQVTGGGLPRHFPPLRSLGSVANNLPLQLTSFVGRDDAVAAVRTLVADDRLVTLTGSAGCGKTRLAVHVAAELLDDFPDGVSFVDLAPLSDSDLVPDAIASAAGVANQSSTRTTTDTIVAHLATRRTLLLLDNCEHVLGAAAIAVQEILRGCPHVRIVATSREPLGITGEATWRVPPLGLASGTEPLDASPAVQLFTDRARLRDNGFSWHDDRSTAAAVAQICRRLDGIPLAIELAAARVSALTCTQIAERLDDRFRLLTGGSRTALERHQTMRAAIDWSYHARSEPERLLLARLSVFAGGDRAGARDQLHQVLAAAHEVGIPAWEAGARRVLGDLALCEQDLASARSCYRESLALLAPKARERIHVLAGLGRHAHLTGNAKNATRILAAVEAELARRALTTLLLGEAHRLTIAALREQLGDDVFDRDWAIGAVLSLDETLEAAS